LLTLEFYVLRHDGHQVYKPRRVYLVEVRENLVTTQSGDPSSDQTIENQFALERYKYILRQIHAVNENVYRFLAIYQTLVVTLTSGGLALFLGYRKWGIQASVARTGMLGLMWLITVIAAFVVLLIIVGLLSWLDYRREECRLTDTEVRPGFREPPHLTNFFRWYETYIILFIFVSIAFLWGYTLGLILPEMK
jgi:uncharacterized membrane protein